MKLSVNSLPRIYKSIRLDESSEGEAIDTEEKKRLFRDLGHASS